MATNSDPGLISVHTPPHWTKDLVRNLEWGANIDNLDLLSKLESIAPEYAIPTVLEDRIVPISVGTISELCIGATYVGSDEHVSRWDIPAESAFDTSPRASSERVLLSTTVVSAAIKDRVPAFVRTYEQNGALLRTYVVLAKRITDGQPVRLQVVPWVGEFMVEGMIIPLPDATYEQRSERMTSVYIGLPVIAEPEDAYPGSKWYTFWYRARLDGYNTHQGRKSFKLTVAEGPYSSLAAIPFIVPAADVEHGPAVEERRARVAPTDVARTKFGSQPATRAPFFAPLTIKPSRTSDCSARSRPESGLQPIQAYEGTDRRAAETEGS
ncbi:uncharacterized protein B0H18DRAFT_1120162 [Fomitopsis serialis]|uniref:uncharacterized protein n=1 Tax=Fomitopsis serialis TaxID=139415 RepID=UPI0020087BE8|nr:uncharacterized protein B0H18DRAFT_1120162 [Neoantrodia serialis]KAH9924090.1 hypothetical protein B0H18DRAFT_1120162 [Neoantrodia serialis]